MNVLGFSETVQPSLFASTQRSKSRLAFVSFVSHDRVPARSPRPDKSTLDPGTQDIHPQDSPNSHAVVAPSNKHSNADAHIHAYTANRHTARIEHHTIVDGCSC